MNAGVQKQPESINWPARYHPDASPVHVRNEILIPADVRQVWAWLCRAPLWPTWYPNSHRVRAADGSRLGDLALGSVFRWTTFSVPIESRVMECIPLQRLAWDARGVGLDVYHAWLLVPSNGGTLVITEESQHGWGARLVNFMFPHRMYEGHDVWLRSLAIQCSKGEPPAI